MNSDYKSDHYTWGGSKNGPFYTDPNEGLVHRKGVEVVGGTLPHIPWATPGPGRMPIGVRWYPNGKGEHSNYDLYVKTRERLKDVGVEVVTDHNNTQQLVEKWKRYNRKNCCTLWVFDGRSSACSLFNKLDSQGLVYLDGGTFSSASNWSSKAMNRKIQRSAGHPSSNQGDDIVQTITGVLEGGEDPIDEAYDEYYSNN